jgi:predicted TIM-barrel fold metal-dependent hydrolase
MPIIDADTHVDETEDTWAEVPEDLRPTTAYPENPDPGRPATRYWIIDGLRHPRFTRDDAKTGTTVETRELLDVGARVAAMDRMGVATQVVYPTLLLLQPTDQPATDTALRRSYNRWLGARSDRSSGRLRWVFCPMPFDIEGSVQEMRWAKDHGAVGVLKKGDREAGKWPNDPYFFPLYKAAEALDLPLCFHVGTGVMDRVPAKELSYGRFIRIGLPIVHGFHSMILHGIPQQFPKLRFGFIEAGAGWVPYVTYDLRRRIPHSGGSAPRLDPSYFDGRMFFSCQVDEDFGLFMHVTGENTLVVGSDYTHGDASQELEFANELNHRAAEGALSTAAAHKILDENAKILYGL